MKTWLKKLTEAAWFEKLVVALIIVNSAVLALEAYPNIKAAYGTWLVAIDKTILVFFLFELAARMTVNGRKFFRDAWSLFDLAVVAVALMPMNEAWSVLRSLRVLRALRLISALPALRRLVEGLVRALPGVASIGAIMMIIFFVFGVMASKLFGAAFPQWFGNLNASLFTLFQVMTLEGWADIVRQIKEVYPLSWLFFIVYILVATFTILNLFVAVMIDAIQRDHNIESKNDQKEALEDIGRRLDELGRKVDELAKRK